VTKKGGAERLVLDLARTQSRLGVSTKIVTWRAPDRDSLPLDLHSDTGVTTLHPFTWAKARTIVQWISEADLIHVHLFPSLYLGALFNKPLIYTEHNTTNRRRKHRVLKILERIIYKRYHRVVAISEAAAEGLRDWLWPSTVPVVVVENGIDAERFCPIERAATRPMADIVYVGMAARFTSQKDQDCLVRSLLEVPNNIRLKFAGDGPRLADVKALACRLGLRDRVEFLGDVDDIASYYRDIDIYVQSSHWEGFGLAIVEAMASGLPCLASNVEGLADVLGDADYLFPAGDHKALAEKILRIVSQPDVWNGALQYSKARPKRYSLERCAMEYSAVYAEVVGRARGDKRL
jgi:glycosyltransferase involved in cell wall biosynthesis